MTMTFDPQRLRREYGIGALDEAEIAADPIEQFHRWLRQAIDAHLIEANAMSVATVDRDGTPSSRMVLLKQADARGFVFATSFASAKGDDLAANPRSALLFYWAALERQVRVNGVVERVTAEESDAIFDARSRDSRIGASVSPQSQVIPSRAWLEQRVTAVREGLAHDAVPERPDWWGGYRVVPETIEFWQGRQNRLHDRLRYRRDGEAWLIERVAP